MKRTTTLMKRRLDLSRAPPGLTVAAKKRVLQLEETNWEADFPESPSNNLPEKPAKALSPRRPRQALLLKMEVRHELYSITCRSQFPCLYWFLNDGDSLGNDFRYHRS